MNSPAMQPRPEDRKSEEVAPRAAPGIAPNLSMFPVEHYSDLLHVLYARYPGKLDAHLRAAVQAEYLSGFLRTLDLLNKGENRLMLEERLIEVALHEKDDFVRSRARLLLDRVTNPDVFARWTAHVALHNLREERLEPLPKQRDSQAKNSGSVDVETSSNDLREDDTSDDLAYAIALLEEIATGEEGEKEKILRESLDYLKNHRSEPQVSLYLRNMLFFGPQPAAGHALAVLENNTDPAFRKELKRDVVYGKKVSYEALAALRGTHDPEVTEFCLNILRNSSDSSHRAGAAHALYGQTDSRVVTLFKRLLFDSSLEWRVRSEVAESLGAALADSSKDDAQNLSDYSSRLKAIALGGRWRSAWLVSATQPMSHRQSMMQVLADHFRLYTGVALAEDRPLELARHRVAAALAILPSTERTDTRVTEFLLKMAVKFGDPFKDEGLQKSIARSIQRAIDRRWSS